ncbi:hypothetical protein ABN034_24905 [Actinopolymorpha sp. B11F2]|uniref:hypothetical protein n=1 Tax=Actinopolymorpha sp. B11F2 TaxID=3160862 RepID=UPI0032E49814
MTTIPTTLLLEERAALAMNAVVGLADVEHGHLPFFSANLLAKPAYLRYGDWAYGSSHGRLLDAAILARHMTGQSRWRQTEEQYKKGLLSFFGEDGLSYRQRHPKGSWEPNANLIDQRAVILALTTSYLDTQDPAVKAAADRHVAALRRIAVKERDAWFYPASEYTPRGWPSANAAKLHLAPDPASFSGRLIMPLLRYHQATGNSDALELCEWFTKLLVDKSGVFNSDGSFNAALAYRNGHLHTRLGTLDGIAKFAEHTGNHALTAFVERGFTWALTQATAFGWTPGDLTEQRFEHETCSLVDLIGIAVTLARMGYTDNWTVVERFVRNHLVESQLDDLEWVESAPDRSRDEPGWVTYYDVGRRVRGAFAGYGAPNDYVADVALGRGHTADVQACCVGSGVRGLFTAWNAIVTGAEDLIRVNLLLTRRARLVEVVSHLPYQGRVDLTIRGDCRELRVRTPPWAGYAKLTVERTTPAGETATTSGHTPELWAPDGYLRILTPRVGERISISFPMSVRNSVERAAGQEFLTTWRGDDVTAIRPRGTFRPMYEDRPTGGAAPLRQCDLACATADWVW